MRSLKDLPKGHLHLHFDAAMRSTTIEEFATVDGVVFEAHQTYDDFSGFGAAYRSLVDLLTSQERLDRAMDEIVEDAANEGVCILELTMVPNRYKSVFETAHDAHAAMTASAARAAARHGVWVGIVSAIDRTAGVVEAVRTASVAASWAGHGVVGLGLQSDERGFPARDFEEAFALGRRAGLLSVPHAGELVGPESVRQAIDILGADRIGHGVRAVEDQLLVRDIITKGVCLDVCPTSNVQLGVVTSYESHPLRDLIVAGVACSINADDPILFQTTLLKEFEIARELLGLDDDQLANCARQSIVHSAAPRDVKFVALEGVTRWLGE